MLHHISGRQKAIVMSAVMSALFLVALDQTIISTALGKIVEEFNSFSSLGWVVTAYLLTTTVTVPIAGKLSDIFGRRLMLMIGVVLFTLASLLSGSSQNIDQLIIYRAFQGIGGGIIMANAFTIVGDLFNPRERGRWQGLIGAVFGLSSVIGPLLGGFLTDAHNIFGATTDWRWTFWINVPVGIISFLIIWKFMPLIRHEHKPKIDYLGAASLTGALASLILAVDNTEKIFAGLIDDGVSLTVIKTSLFTLSAIFAGLFVWFERRAKEPIIPLSFFKNRTFSTVMVAFLFFGAAFLGTILYLTQFNQQVFGATATTAGLMLMPMIIALSVTAAISGQIVSKTGKYKSLLMTGYVVATIAMFFLITLTPQSPYWHEAVIMAFVGFGLGTGMPIMNLAVQNEFEQRDLGAATASSQLFRGLGSTVGTAILGSILTASLTTSLGQSLNTDPYIETLKQSPAASQIVGNSGVTTDTALTLNTHDIRTKITGGFDEAIQKSAMPEPAKEVARESFNKQQQEFSDKIVNAFSDGLRHIFIVSSILMLLAAISASFIKEKPLRGGHSDSPGVA